MSAPNYPPTLAERARAFTDRDSYAGIAAFAGLVCAIFGVVIGLRMALHATLVDGDTYVHRQAGVGTAIVVISVMLEILISLCGVIARAMLARQANDDPAELRSTE
jgi:hypothetical protein